MPLKIERVPLPRKDSPPNGVSLKEFIVAAKTLKVGESFEFTGLTSNHRNCLSVLQYAFDRQFSCRKIDEEKSRIFRVS